MKFLITLFLFVASVSQAQLVNTPQMALAAQGKSFIASSGPMTLAVAGNMRAVFKNSVGSNVRMMITAVSTVNTSGSTVFANLYLNPTTGLPTADGYLQNTDLNLGPAARSTFKADTNLTALSGGTLIMPLSIPSGRTILNSTVIVLEPGDSIGFNLPFVGASIGEVIIYYSEI